MIYEVLENFRDNKKNPHRRYLMRLSALKDIPDRLYVIIKENWPFYGLFLKKKREFSKPHLRALEYRSRLP